jgi:hypothetical protein
MKEFVLASIGLLVGLAIGGYGGYHFHERHATDEAVKLMLEGTEVSEAEHAARATRAIEWIQSGETEKAVRALSKPIAYYYLLYAEHSNTDRRRQICAMIDRLASTNKIVAEEITNELSYAQTHGKAR